MNMNKLKTILAVVLLFLGVQLLEAQNGQATELLLVSQPTMSYHGDHVRLYYDVQNIGIKRYKGKVYIYLDPDNGYYYAEKKIRVRKGKIKRVKIDVPTARLMSDTVYTVMPYYSIGSQLYSFTIFEDFGLTSFCVSKPAQTKYLVNTEPTKVVHYTYSQSATRYYYDGYARSPQVNTFYSTPYHHTYQYHSRPNHGYYGPHYMTPQGNPISYPPNNPPQPNNWNHTAPPHPVTGYNPPRPNPRPHYNHNHNNYPGWNNNNNHNNQSGGNNNGTTLDPNNQAQVHQGSAGSMSSHTTTHHVNNGNNQGGNNNGGNNQGGNPNGGNNASVNHNNNQNQNQGGTAGRTGTTGTNGRTDNSNNSGTNTNVNPTSSSRPDGNTTTTTNSGNASAGSTSGTSGRTGTTTSGRNNISNTNNSGTVNSNTNNGASTSGTTGRTGTTTTGRSSSSQNETGTSNTNSRGGNNNQSSSRRN